MKSKSLGFDPKLGAKFMEESNRLVIGRAQLSQKTSEAEAIEEAKAKAEAIEEAAVQEAQDEAIEEYSEEHGRAPDAQQLHDWMNKNT